MTNTTKTEKLQLVIETWDTYKKIDHHELTSSELREIDKLLSELYNFLDTGNSNTVFRNGEYLEEAWRRTLMKGKG